MYKNFSNAEFHLCENVQKNVRHQARQSVKVSYCLNVKQSLHADDIRLVSLTVDGHLNQVYVVCETMYKLFFSLRR